jgi:hypothetical protein
MRGGERRAAIGASANRGQRSHLIIGRGHQVIESKNQVKSKPGRKRKTFGRGGSPEPPEAIEVNRPYLGCGRGHSTYNLVRPAT